GEGLGEVLVGMALGVPMIKMMDEALAVRLRRVVLGVRRRGRTEQATPCGTATEQVGIVDGMAGLVPQNAKTRVSITALHLQHLRELEVREARMREVERNRDARHAVGGEPLVRKPEIRTEAQIARLELGVELRDARLEVGAFDRDPKVAHADLEELLIRQIGPGRIRHHKMVLLSTIPFPARTRRRRGASSPHRTGARSVAARLGAGSP